MSALALSASRKTSLHTLTHGFEFHHKMAPDGDLIEISLTHNGEPLCSGEFDLEHTHQTFAVSTRSVQVNIDIAVEMFLGEVTATGTIKLRNPATNQWDTVATFNGRVLCRFNPTLGEVAGSATSHPPIVQSAQFGNSVADSSTVTRIFVDDHTRLITNVGQMVKRSLFANHGDMAINIVACVGPHDSAGVGAYANPNSIWFNVFLGYYQIDAPKAQWSRPFGYQSANGFASQVDFDDLLRLGKSDWNFFSNWLYGTPLEFVMPYVGIDTGALRATQSPAGQIGSSLWHHVSMTNWEVVTGYESNAPGAAQLVDNSALSPSWRSAFGLPNPQPNWPESFIGQQLWTQSCMAYYEDDQAYHTLIFGGSGPGDGDPNLAAQFLQVQLAAVQAVIAQSYPTLGFPLQT